MQAVLLVGGFGTRLAEITKQLGMPKPMVPVSGKPFLEHLLVMLKNEGFTDFVFCTYYQGDKIKNYFGDGSKWQVKINYSNENKPLLSAGAVKLAENYLEEDFFVINGDDYFPIDYNGMMKLHKDKNALITIAGKKWKEAYLGKYAGFSADSKSQVNSYYSKESSNSKNSGYGFFAVFLLKKDILKKLQKNVELSLEKDVLPNIVKTGRVYSYLSEAKYSEIGTPEKYREFCEYIKEKKFLLE